MGSCLLSNLWLNALELSAFSAVSPSNTGKGENTPDFACRGPCSCLVDMEYPISSSHTARHQQIILEIEACAVASSAYWAIYESRVAGIFPAVAFAYTPYIMPYLCKVDESL